MSKSSAGQYQQINAQTGVVDADPHRLIQMLYAGALDQIAIAKGCMERGDVEGKGAAIGKAIGIVGGLRDSLNDSIESMVGDNLAALYDFSTQRLAQANATNNTAALDDVSRVLRELQAGWNSIRDDALNQLRASEGAQV